MIYVIAVLLFLILVVLFYKFVLKKKETDDYYKIKENDKNTLAIKEKFMFQIELKVLALMNEACSPNFIALPKVSLGNLLEPKGSKVTYNAIAEKTVDFVIFEKSTMKAVLIVDIFDNTFSDEALAEQDPSLNKLLSDLNLPVLSILVKGSINAEEFKQTIKNKLEPQKNKEEQQS